MPVKSKEGEFLGLLDRIRKIQVALSKLSQFMVHEIFQGGGLFLVGS